MDKNITFHVIEDGNIERCRELCNELMIFQGSKAVNYIGAFERMSFETRMVPSYESAEGKLVITAECDGIPIGYIFASIEQLARENIHVKKEMLPIWVQSSYEDDEIITGLYPLWMEPQPVGHINNLYVKYEFRKYGLGRQLMDKAMEWLFENGELEYIFVHVSNGNTAAEDFYKKFGFEYSHDVFKGFIYGYYKKIR